MEARAQSSTPVLTTIGVDIGKDVFHIVGFDADGKIALRRKIKRLAFSETFKKLAPCVVGMEACLSALSLAGRCGLSDMNHALFQQSTSSRS
jgi:hypothetical protein